MTTKIQEIISSKINSGDNAYLWLQSTDGDCLLWPTRDASENEDNADEIGRWDITVDEAKELLETGEVEEISADTDKCLTHVVAFEQADEGCGSVLKSIGDGFFPDNRARFYPAGHVH